MASRDWGKSNRDLVLCCLNVQYPYCIYRTGSGLSSLVRRGRVVFRHTRGPLGCQSRRQLLTVVQEEPRWCLPTAVLDLAGGEAFVVATVAVSTPAGFLFACSLSVFICGLHLVCTSHTGICRLLILLSKHLSWPGRPKKKKKNLFTEI